MANLVVLVVVILGLINGGYCRETAQEGPWRIHTLFSVECHNYLFSILGESTGLKRSLISGILV
ncbi:hypothetical protein CsSME_00026030 [Camellia sinensis var. sinensis]